MLTPCSTSLFLSDTNFANLSRYAYLIVVIYSPTYLSIYPPNNYLVAHLSNYLVNHLYYIYIYACPSTHTYANASQQYIFSPLPKPFPASRVAWLNLHPTFFLLSLLVIFTSEVVRFPRPAEIIQALVVYMHWTWKAIGIKAKYLRQSFTIVVHLSQRIRELPRTRRNLILQYLSRCIQILSVDELFMLTIPHPM